IDRHRMLEPARLNKSKKTSTSIGNDLDRQSVSPAVFFTRELLNLAQQRLVRPLVQYPRRRVKARSPDSTLDPRLSSYVLDPLRVFKALGKDIEERISLHKPDFDLPR